MKKSLLFIFGMFFMAASVAVVVCKKDEKKSDAEQAKEDAKAAAKAYCNCMEKYNYDSGKCSETISSYEDKYEDASDEYQEAFEAQWDKSADC
jgi:hypothetical protein